MAKHELADNCPRCLRRDVAPIQEAEDYDGNTYARYQCPSCTWSWRTQRTARPEESRYAVYDDPDAWEADDDFSDYDQERSWS
jgi:transposase-like protein